AVHRAEAGEGAVVAAVAATDREHLRALRTELARHVLDRRERLRHAHGTVPAHDLGQAPRALRTAVAVRPGVRIDDDADAGHVRPPPRRAARRRPGCPAPRSRGWSRAPRGRAGSPG